MLPPLDDLRSVDPAQAEAFRADGHTCIRHLLTRAEIAAYRPPIMRTAAANRWDHRPLAERDTYGRAFLQMFNLWRQDPNVARFVLARRLGHVAATLLGVERVRIYHDQALVKESGGGYTPWHQDQGYWPLDTNDTVTLWMPLVDVAASVGSMSFASGSHRDGDVAAGHISDASHKTIDEMVRTAHYPIVTYGAMAAGDATFHTGWTLHRAGPNDSVTDREAMTIIYVADGARITEPTPQQRGDLHWLGGAQPGQAVDSAMNPVV